ncbi:hypothetical protein JCM15548_14457 [Geofilum rubicundum JCM 15548]|uniref:Uncharacterized protein n=2 Tax=Geofilum TaxID=1236988 RepID=A0A0E9LQU8_9BACT|nr:hypothetical protein JCM15548_14457 [Geofilum rubicundum JCM 15548]
MVFGIFLFMTVNGLAQGTGVSFKDSWANMLAQDDHEKNFRFSHFVDSLNTLVGDLRPDSVNGNMPAGWTNASNETNSLVVMAGVLPFDSEPDRLIWMVQPQSDTGTASVFASPLSSATEALKSHYFA